VLLERRCRVLGREVQLRRDLAKGEGGPQHARIALEVPALLEAAEHDDELGLAGRQHRADLRHAPGEVLPLVALAVGVGGREEAALGAAHLAEEIIGGFARHAEPLRPVEREPGLPYARARSALS